MGSSGGAGAGLALLELSVGVGGDAGGVGQGFLAEAPGDAGALQLHTQLAGDEPPLLVTWLVEEEAPGRGPLLIAPEGVLEERRQQSRTKQRPTELAQWQRVQPLPVAQLQRSQPGVEHHEEDAGQGEGDGQEGGLQATEAMMEG